MREHCFLFTKTAAIEACTGGKRGTGRGRRLLADIMMKSMLIEEIPQDWIYANIVPIYEKEI